MTACRIIFPAKTSAVVSSTPGAKMTKNLAVLAGTMIAAVWFVPAALAQLACVTQNMVVPPNPFLRGA